MVSKEHFELSEFIKSVHQELRVNSKLVGPDRAWNDHCKNEAVLKKYATAMRTLATNHWTKNTSISTDQEGNRITWVISHCQKYFYFNDWENELKKEIAIAEKHKIDYDLSLLNNFDSYKQEGSMLEMLDVGSCYNPFKHVGMFRVTAIDLYPATDDVIRCDFLNTAIGDPECNAMVKEHFDVVVFSLFLEYLPSSVQRFNCCLKAYDLLKPSGLLFILTPDSKHATANSRLMKKWRICLSSIGFTRVYYEKLKHLHSMAFKKTFIKELPKKWFRIKNISETSPQEMMSIPQDYSVAAPVLSSDYAQDSQLSNDAEVTDNFKSLPLEEF